MRADIDNHVQTCLKCQKHKKKAEKSPLQPLPIPDQPNQRVHMDLFGPLIGSDQGKKFVLTMTDAFTKFAKATVIDNKSAQTVAQAIFDTWISFIGVPHQIHTDQGKEFVNEVCKTLCTELLITHTRTAAYHPQANAQAEVFNKHIQKYLARFVSEHTLDWEQYIPTMLFSYNTSVHSSTNTSPFEALFGFRPNMPSLIQQEIQRLHYQDDVTINRIKVLKSLQSDMRETLINKQAEYKERFDRKAFDHNIGIGDEVMEKIHQFSNKNTKLAEKWNGPYKVINIDAKNANIEVKGKAKTVTVDNLKKFFRPAPQEAKPIDDNRRVTRSRAKLINLPTKPNIQAVAKLINLKPSIKDSRYKLKDIAYKLYHLKLAFNQLTSTEQKLWTSFKLADILQLLSGHPNREPIFKSNDVYFGAPIRRPQALLDHDLPPEVDHGDGPGPDDGPGPPDGPGADPNFPNPHEPSPPPDASSSGYPFPGPEKRKRRRRTPEPSDRRLRSADTRSDSPPPPPRTESTESGSGTEQGRSRSIWGSKRFKHKTPKRSKSAEPSPKPKKQGFFAKLDDTLREMAELDVEIEEREKAEKAARKAEKRAQKLAAGPSSLGLFGFMGAALFGHPDDHLLDGSFD
jgi:transposase InsO family protein